MGINIKENSIYILLALLVLTASAYVSITLPISEKSIPFTAQSLVVFILAGVLRPRIFCVVLLAYLVLGVCGMPVFADGSAGWSKIIGASGGFLYGFLFSGLTISYLIRAVYQNSSAGVLLAMIIGTLILFVCGLSHLSFKFGWSKALEYGLYPFWIMALVKAGLAAFVVILVQTKVKNYNND